MDIERNKMVKVLVLIFCFTNMTANSELSIDSLLSNIEIKTDLSNKTKLENSGIRNIYTRSDLDRMQARNLKDILKSSQPLGYAENRYGLADTLTLNSNHPFVSSMIRVYIDNQEITSGLYGSGLLSYGDMDIGFVDHIEIYSGTPTYEFSPEATFIIIKLYSKVASKDGGSKIMVNYGSYDASHINFYNSSELDNDWAYFTYVSQNNEKRKKYYSHGTKLSRDKEVTHVFGSFYNKDNHILIDAFTQKRDTFINRSLDATPTKADLDLGNIHVGYNGKNNNFSYLVSYEHGTTKSNFTDDLGPITSLIIDTKSKVINTDLKYTYETLTNKFMIGIKYRLKEYEYENFIQNNYDIQVSVPIANMDNTKQVIKSIFIENRYSIKDNAIITVGINKSEVRNNNSNQDDNILMYRLGFTNTSDNWVFKTLYTHNELVLEPYMVSGEGIYITPGKKKPQEEDLFIENISYSNNNNKYEIIFSKLTTKNNLLPTLETQGLIDNYDKMIKIYSAILGYTHKYNEHDKLNLTASHYYREEAPLLDTYKEYFITLLNLNKYGLFDIFNEGIYYKNNFENKSYFDYSMGIIYHKTKDLSISVKGVNILNKSKRFKYNRYNPTTMAAETPLRIPSVERSITLTVEYAF